MKLARWLVAAALWTWAAMVAAQSIPASNSLPAGSRILPGGIVTSSNGLARLVMQYDGNLVLYDGNWNAIWHAGTHNNPGAWATLQTDGNLVVYSWNGVPLYNIFDFSKNPHAVQVAPPGGHEGFLTVENDGNMIVFASEIRWDSYGNWYFANLSPATLLRAGAYLPSGGSIVSPNGRYQLLMQADGNLVHYDLWDPNPATRVKWASWTHGHWGAYAVMQSDGNFVIYSVNGQVLWHSLTGPRPDGNLAHLNLHDNGALKIVVYRRNFQVLGGGASSGANKWCIKCDVDAFFGSWNCYPKPC